MSSRNWARGVDKLKKSEESEAGNAASRKSSRAGVSARTARIFGALGSHLLPVDSVVARERVRDRRCKPGQLSPRDPLELTRPAPQAPLSR